MPAGSAVLDVTDATFATDVLAASNSKPVVVDFWAPWCGPCRILGPIIESVAASTNGEVLLAKLNTDENPRTATQYRIQGIPAVKAFRNGRVVSEFTGAVPEPQVREFFKRLTPTPAERAAAEAAALAATDPAAAEKRYREALAATSGNADAIVGLAKILLDRGERDEAEKLLGRAPTDRRAKAMKHQLFLDDFARKHAGEDIEGEAAGNPRDPRAQYRLGVLLASRGQYQQALDRLIASLQADRGFAEGAARKAVLAIFDILGQDAPLTREYQKRLSSVLF